MCACGLFVLGRGAGGREQEARRRERQIKTPTLCCAKDGAPEKSNVKAWATRPPLLMASAISAVKEWKYRPTMLNGQPVEVDTTVQVVFSLV